MRQQKAEWYLRTHKQNSKDESTDKIRRIYNSDGENNSNSNRERTHKFKEAVTITERTDKFKMAGMKRATVA